VEQAWTFHYQDADITSTVSHSLLTQLERLSDLHSLLEKHVDDDDFFQDGMQIKIYVDGSQLGMVRMGNGR